jgi:hypothetical protein
VSSRILFIPALALVTVVGCIYPTDPVDRLRLELAVSRTEIIAGDSVRIAVRLINPTRDTVTVSGNTCLLSFQVIDPEGETVTIPGGCADILMRFTIAPGDTLIRERMWASLRGPDPDNEIRPLAAGTYRVFGILDAEQARRVTRPKSLHLLLTAS